MSAARGSLASAVTRNWSLSGIFTYQSGTPFSVIGNPTRNAFFAQVARPRVSFAPGKTIDDAVKSGPVQDRLDNYFDVTAFQDSLDQWGNTGRNILRGPSQAQVDLTLARTLALTRASAARGAVGGLQRAEHARLREPGVHVCRQRIRHGGARSPPPSAARAPCSWPLVSCSKKRTPMRPHTRRTVVLSAIAVCGSRRDRQHATPCSTGRRVSARRQRKPHRRPSRAGRPDALVQRQYAHAHDQQRRRQHAG